MKILVLEGCGIQGRTALFDLASDPHVSEIICKEIFLLKIFQKDMQEIGREYNSGTALRGKV